MAVLVLAPVLAIGGVWNAFSWPLAATYVLAIVTSLVVALIVTPALAVLLLRDGRQELRAGPLDRWVRSAADRLAGRRSASPAGSVSPLGVLVVAGILVATLAASGPVLPTLQDRNVLVRVQGAPGTSLTEMNRITSTVATEMRGAPGIESAGAHVGRAITSDEIVDVNAGEIWLTVAPGADYDATLAGVRDIAAGYPGLHTSVRTYAEDRVAAAREKVGDELVVRVYGADFATLHDTADDVASMLSTVTGVLSPRVEPQVTEPTLEIEVDLAAAQRHGLRPGDVRREATTLISGLAVGNLFEEQKVFDVVVWGGPGIRQSLSDLEALRIDTPSGEQVRLGEVAKVRIAPDPVAIDHNSVSRSLDVTAVVNGRSPADVSQEVTSRLRGISFPYEYRAEVLGDAVQQQADHRRVAAIAAVVVLLSFLILQAATGSWGLAASAAGHPARRRDRRCAGGAAGRRGEVDRRPGRPVRAARARHTPGSGVRTPGPRTWRGAGGQPRPGGPPGRPGGRAICRWRRARDGSTPGRAGCDGHDGRPGNIPSLCGQHAGRTGDGDGRHADRSPRLLPGDRQPGHVERKGGSGDDQPRTRI